MQEGFELEVVFKLRYFAKPENYMLYLESENLEITDQTPYLMAAIDASNFAADPEMLFERLVTTSDSEITVAPIVRLDD